jgi:hypothetical protein
LRAQRKIERWRERRGPRERIPDDLWREAAQLAYAYGIHRTANAMRLNYYSLKERVAGVASPGENAPQFVEVVGGATGGGECLIEMEDAGGVKMRIRIPAGERPDLVALARVFREGRS